MPAFYLIVFAAIAFAVYSSTSIKYVRILSLTTTWVFIALIIGMWAAAFVFGESEITAYFTNLGLLAGTLRTSITSYYPLMSITSSIYSGGSAGAS